MRKSKQPSTAIRRYYLFSKGIQYVCTVTFPVEIPEYRVHEAFDLIYTQSDKLAALETGKFFHRLHPDITYTIETV